MATAAMPPVIPESTAGNDQAGANPTMKRRHDLDALRAFAMLLGIVLHGAIPFIPGVAAVWPVADSEPRAWFGVLLSAIHGFRMPLFFLVSGFFTAMMFRKRGLGPLLSQRAKRILLPLVIGLFTIIPASWIVPGVLNAIASRQVNQAAPADEGASTQSLPAAAPELMLAVATNNAEQVRGLVDAGAEVNAIDEQGSTPLHASIFFGYPEITKVLLDAGADLNAKNATGSLPAEGLKAPWLMTQGIAAMFGIQLDEDEFNQGRREIAQMLGEEQVEPPPGHWAGNGLIGILMQIPLMGHLWFLWFLCWLVALYAVFVKIGAALNLGTLPAWLTASGMRFLWLVPLTALAELLMNQTGQGDFGPATSIGPIPMPSVFAYYSIFFFFGVAYFDAKDEQGKLGRYWWLTLPVGFFVLLPLGLQAVGKSDWGGIMVSVFCQAGYVWLVSCGLMGLCRSLLSRELLWVRYISDSSYWLYLVHIPLIYIPQFLVRNWEVPPILKFALVCVTTTVVLLVTYEWFVRYTFIGTLLNGPRTRVPRDDVSTASA